MRLYPPAWIIGRRAIDEYPLGEYVVPPRSILVMSPYVIQRDPRFYADPERFDPDRWTPEFRAGAAEVRLLSRSAAARASASANRSRGWS